MKGCVVMDDQSNILVIEEKEERRRLLVDIIEREIKPRKCIEAESAETASQNVDQQSVSFAIIESHHFSQKDKKIADNIKLCCPMLPVLEVLIERDEFNCVNTPKKEVSKYEIDRIISGIRYVESLTKSGIAGFTVVIRI